MGSRIAKIGLNVFKKVVQTDEQVSKTLESGRFMVWEIFHLSKKSPEWALNLWFQSFQ